MSDFVPGDMLTIQFNPREELSLHEMAQAGEIYIRGAYFVNAPPNVQKKDNLIKKINILLKNIINY